MSRGVTISKQYGVNPSVTRCVCCGKEYGIALFGTCIKDRRTGKTMKAPPFVFQGLCDKCQKVVDAGGLMIIEIRDGERGDNPYRTGRLVGCSKEFREKNGIQNPIIYMEKTMFSQLFDDYLKDDGTD